MDFMTILQNFGFPVACVVALGWYANSTTNKLIALTEQVTTAMSENSNNMRELSDAIRDLIQTKEDIKHDIKAD